MKLNWAERWAVNNPTRPLQQGFEMQWMKRRRSLASGSVVLELGCGRGAGAVLIRKIFQPAVLQAMDLDLQMIRRGRAYISKGEREEISFYVADVMRIPARSGSLVFGLDMTRALWRSYVAHELAHAASDSRFAPGVSTFTASEYIAAVVQVSVLPEHIRQALLANFAGLAGFGAKSEINSTYYFIDPCAFAVKSYLHYSRPENGPSFIAALLREGI